MMIRPAELAAIKAGTVDLAFRRWARPRVVVGTRMRTAVGLLEVTSVEQVSVASLRADDARRAGSAVAGRAEAGAVGAVVRPGLADRTGVRRTRPARGAARRGPGRRRDRGDHRAPRPARRVVGVRPVDAGDARPDRPPPDRTRPRPGRAGGARDGGLQEGRPQAQGARAHRVAGDRLPAVAARRGRRRRRPAGAARTGPARRRAPRCRAASVHRPRRRCARSASPRWSR